MKLGKYQHFKGRIYEVIGIAKHTETLEELVVYRDVYDSKDFQGNDLWVRPKTMFMGDVIIEGNKIPRFKYIEE